jgi:glycosyltransferase involved in cell wall biosynthesis
MNEQVLISVVMLIYNPDQVLERCIKSVIGQTLRSLEFIIVDCDRTGYTSTILEQFQDEKIVNIVNWQPNYIDSLNKAISQSKGKYITLTDSNSILHKQKLEKQYMFLENNIDIDSCITRVKTFGSCSFNIRNSFSRDETTLTLLTKNPIISSSIMFRKSSLIEYGLFQELYEKEFLYVENYRLWTVLITKGCRFGFLPEVLLDYWISGYQYPLEVKRYILAKEAHIQIEYINYINKQIANVDISKTHEIEDQILLFEKRQIDFETLKLKISDLYQSLYLKDKPINHKKNILFCIPSLESGGAEKQLIVLLEKIDYTIYNVDLLILNRCGVYFKDIPQSVNWYTLSYFEKYSVTEYDTEIAFLEGISTKYIANRETKAKKLAWVRVDLYNFHWTKVFFKDLNEEKLCYQKFDRILFNSNETLERFTQCFGDLPVQKTVLYNLIDKEKIVGLSNEYSITHPNVVTLCSIGRLHVQKAYERLIRALDALKREGLSFHYWIIGEGNLKEKLEKMISHFSLEKDISLIGFVKNPFPYLKCCDIFVQASLAEGFSLVVAEAICLGKPILVTNTAGPSELMDYGKYGCVVDNNYDDILNGIRELILNNEKRNDLSKKSISRSSMFDIEKSVRDVMNIIG